MASVEERVKAVTGRVLGIDPSEIGLDQHFAADLGAESVQSVELVANFEEEFGIEMDGDEALSVETVGGPCPTDRPWHRRRRTPPGATKVRTSAPTGPVEWLVQPECGFITAIRSSR